MIHNVLSHINHVDILVQLYLVWNSGWQSVRWFALNHTNYVSIFDGCASRVLACGLDWFYLGKENCPIFTQVLLMDVAKKDWHETFSWGWYIWTSQRCGGELPWAHVHISWNAERFNWNGNGSYWVDFKLAVKCVANNEDFMEGRLELATGSYLKLVWQLFKTFCFFFWFSLWHETVFLLRESFPGIAVVLAGCLHPLSCLSPACSIQEQMWFVQNSPSVIEVLSAQYSFKELESFFVLGKFLEKGISKITWPRDPLFLTWLSLYFERLGLFVDQF